ncbi:MAG: thiosulfate oxidation carrier protein SoxY [Gammaproteobacteria bacterium]|nr:thiosulfate oxidation carrier protein SoxY [Gammaproteobacteria bacterium]
MLRREFSTQSVAILVLSAFAGLTHKATKAQATSWNHGVFEAKNLADAVKAMGGSTPAEMSADVSLNAPEIAENGNVVRIGLSTSNPAVTQIALLVEKNPSVVSAVFDIVPGTDANFSTNIKMGQSSNVYAVAKAGDKFLYAVKEVKVTLGGCGG